jgi:hypothetical protein
LYFVYKLKIQKKYAKIKRVEKVCHNNLPPLQVNKAKASALDKKPSLERTRNSFTVLRIGTRVSAWTIAVSFGFLPASLEGLTSTEEKCHRSSSSFRVC